jgi:hypothetical protein
VVEASAPRPAIELGQDVVEHGFLVHRHAGPHHGVTKTSVPPRLDGAATERQ